jgi:hypothetical protein
MTCLKHVQLILSLFALSSLLFLTACIEGGGDDDDTSVVPDDDDTVGADDDDSAGDDDDTAGDDDTADDDDTGDDDDSVAAAPAPPGQTLCAAGGRVSGKGVSGVICLGPVDLASGGSSQSADGSLVWQPGPITRIAP